MSLEKKNVVNVLIFFKKKKFAGLDFDQHVSTPD